MSIFLERVNALPYLTNSKFDAEFNSWLSVFIDTMNETLLTIETQLNQTSAPPFTTAQIITMSSSAPNGTFWYATDATPPNVVIKINGSLVQLQTTPFP